MDGNTTDLYNDLENEASFGYEVVHLMQTRLQLTDLSPEDVIKLMGIKRTNASTLISIGQKYHNSDISNSGKNRAS